MSSAVEVKSLETGSYYNATLKEYDPVQQKVLVSFENGWKADEYVPLNVVRPAAAPHNPAEFRPVVNDKVEVMAKSSENEPYSFWPAVVKNVRGDFYFISYIAFDEASEILEKDMLRPVNSASVFQPSDFKKLEVALPASLVHKVKSDQFQQLKTNSGALSITVDDKKNSLVILGNAASVERARLLSKMSFKHLEQLVSLQAKTAEKQKQIQELQSRLKNGKLLEFSVEKDLIGLVIGKAGSNIQKAEALAGVLNVRVDADTCVVSILAKTMEACEKARSLLEFVTDSILIPRKDVGRIIGTKASNIKEIEKDTGVSRIRVQDHKPAASSSSLSSSSQWADEEDDLDMECSEVVITGTRDAVANAKLMVQGLIQFVKQSSELNENFRALTSEVNKLSLEAGNIKSNNDNKPNNDSAPKQRRRRNNNNNKQNNDVAVDAEASDSAVAATTSTTSSKPRRQKRERQAAAPASTADQ